MSSDPVDSMIREVSVVYNKEKRTHVESLANSKKSLAMKISSVMRQGHAMGRHEVHIISKAAFEMRLSSDRDRTYNHGTPSDLLTRNVQ